MSFRKTNIIPVALAALTLLSGCSNPLAQDGSDTKPRIFDIPVRNAANEIPPYTLVEGNPIPDHAWLRERASECDSWELGDNGCGHQTPYVAATTQPHEMHVYHHYKKATIKPGAHS